MKPIISSIPSVMQNLKKIAKCSKSFKVIPADKQLKIKGGNGTPPPPPPNEDDTDNVGIEDIVNF
jgi:hypothetical protein